MVQIQTAEEKGSDVNLGSYLLYDAFIGECDTTVVISNDSDLATPIDLTVNQLGKVVGVINPHPKSRRSVVLAGVASWAFQEINKSTLAASQFPDPMADAKGTFNKPASW